MAKSNHDETSRLLVTKSITGYLRFVYKGPAIVKLGVLT